LKLSGKNKEAFMKKIFLQVSSPHIGNGRVFAQDINNINEPWSSLREKLRNLGYELETADEKPLLNCEWIFFLDSVSVDGVEHKIGGMTGHTKQLLGLDTTPFWPKRKLYNEAIEKKMNNKLAIFLYEGVAVNPFNYKKTLWDKFPYIFTWDDDLVDNKKFFKFYLPTPKQPEPSKKYQFIEKKLLVNITINKRSSDKNELYGARRKTIEYFDLHFPDDFDLFGNRWNTPVTKIEKILPFLVKKYKTYRGHADNKIETFSRYKFALCYENLSGAKGYITEKIFDALYAKTVPIYWGAENIETYVDPSAFIDRRKFKNDQELAQFLQKMTEVEYNKYIAAGEKYLKSEQRELFSSENFASTIINTLHLISQK